MDCRNVFGCAEKRADEFIEGMTQLGCLRVRREAGARLLRGARLQRRRAEKTDIALPPGVSGGYGIGGAEESGNPFSGRAA